MASKGIAHLQQFLRGLASPHPGNDCSMSGTSKAAPHVAGLLLINNGKINFVGNAHNDPDLSPDPIAHR